MNQRPVTDLTGCAVKLARAKRQFADLDAVVAKWIEDVNPYRTSGDFDTDGVQMVYRLTEDVIQPPTNDWGPVIGEVAYNLSSALDHLVCQLLIRERGASDCTKTQFPIFDRDVPDFQRKIDGYLKGLLDDDKRLIRDLQPYKRANLKEAHADPLWLLRTVNNTDKHRRLNLMSVGLFPEKKIVAWQDRGVETPDMIVTEGTKAGDEIVRFDTSKVTYAPGQTHLALIIQIAFNDPGSSVHGESIRSLFPPLIRYIREDIFPQFEHRVGKLPAI
jgi:hypothetical protein